VSPRLTAVRPLVLLAALALLAGCTNSTSKSPSTTTGSSAPSGLDSVVVTVKGTAKPQVTFRTPFSVTETVRRILDPGSGATVGAGDRITIDYVGLNGADGKEFDSSFSRGRLASFVMNSSIVKGFYNGLMDLHVGARAVIAVPPDDGYGTEGVPSAGIGPTDTLLFVVHVDDCRHVLTKAQGAVQPVQPGLPTVKRDAKGVPTITMPKSAPPTSLVVAPLIKGAGAVLRKGQTVSVEYVGAIWSGGRVFGSTWQGGNPQSFAVGAGRVIQGLDLGLVGQHVGSQVMIVVPPDKAYGAKGSSKFGIRGTDTLVFVVDILDVTG